MAKIPAPKVEKPIYSIKSGGCMIWIILLAAGLIYFIQ
jgi:hypothetical protein